MSTDFPPDGEPPITNPNAPIWRPEGLPDSYPERWCVHRLYYAAVWTATEIADALRTAPQMRDEIMDCASKVIDAASRSALDGDPPDNIATRVQRALVKIISENAALPHSQGRTSTAPTAKKSAKKPRRTEPPSNVADKLHVFTPTFLLRGVHQDSSTSRSIARAVRAAIVGDSVGIKRKQRLFDLVHRELGFPERGDRAIKPDEVVHVQSRLAEEVNVINKEKREKRRM